MKNLELQIAGETLLSSFNEIQLELVLSSGVEKNLITETVLLHQDKISNYFYVLVSGKLGIRNNKTGSALHNTIDVGEIVGETALMEGAPSKVSVVAIENSTVFEVEISKLKELINQEPEIGALIYRFIAKLNTKRLDTNYSYFCERIAKTANTAKELDKVWGSLEDSILGFKKLLLFADKNAIQNKGVIAKDICDKIEGGFRLFTTDINTKLSDTSPYSLEVKEELGERIKEEILPYLLLTDTAERMYSKPRGYAGDFFTIHSMYENKASGRGRLGPLLDRCFLNEPAGQAVQNRKGIISNEIGELLKDKKELKVTSIACGPATEVFDIFKYENSKGLEVNLLDIDEQAIEFVEERIENNDLSDSINTFQKNLISLVRGKETLEIDDQDLIYSIGLMDYFNDSFVIKFLDYFYSKLKPGGTVIIGNFHPKNTTKALMDYVLDWKLIHRTEEEMNAIFQKSEFGKSCSKIIYETQGVNLFAFCVK